MLKTSMHLKKSVKPGKLQNKFQKVFFKSYLSTVAATIF